VVQAVQSELFILNILIMEHQLPVVQMKFLLVSALVQIFVKGPNIFIKHMQDMMWQRLEARYNIKNFHSFNFAMRVGFLHANLDLLDFFKGRLNLLDALDLLGWISLMLSGGEDSLVHLALLDGQVHLEGVLNLATISIDLVQGCEPCWDDNFVGKTSLLLALIWIVSIIVR
jgi:hypothetical protein